MLRIAAAVVAGHGLIHLLGFVVPWGIAQVEGFPGRTTALGGLVDLCDVGSRAVGAAWLLLAVGFVIAAAGLWRRRSWSRTVAAGLAVASIVVCALGLPEAGIGILVDLAILVGLAYPGLARGRTAARAA